MSEICVSAQISRDMFYRWWNCYQVEGNKSLEEEPKAVPEDPSLDDFLKEKVVNVWQRYGCGPNHKGFDVDHNRVYQADLRG